MGTLSLLHTPNLFFLFHQNPSKPKNPNFSNQRNQFSPISCSLSSLKPPPSRSSNSTSVPALSPSPLIRIPRRTRIETRHALFDYLHYTCNYEYSDADFITRNCPHFIKFLISESKIDAYADPDDVFRAMRRYLSYHPIDEFEPFLESIGINHSKVQSFLPKNVFFLRDDTVLVDNFHVLYYRGVPRNRVWKIYKEAREVFGYDKGVLGKKFQDLEDLGLSKTFINKLVCCCPLLLVGDVDSDFVAVLGWLKKIGIDDEWFVKCMSTSRNYSWKRMFDSIEFLHQVGYNEKQLYDLFTEDPKLLFEGLGKKLYLLLSRLIKSGVDVNVVCNCFVEHSDMLSSDRVENLMNVIAFLFNIRMEQDDIANILSNHMLVLSKHSIKGHKTVCRELGVGKADLCQIIRDGPLELITLASKPEKRTGKESYCDPRSYLEKENFLIKMGYKMNSEEMEEAMKVFKGRGDQLQERFDCLVQAGLEYEAVVRMIKRVPMILNLKKSVIELKIGFLKYGLGYPIKRLVHYPTYFCNDLYKIIARCKMCTWLEKRNAINTPLSLSTIVSANEKRFLKYFVNMHPEGPKAWKRFKSSPNKDKN